MISSDINDDEDNDIMDDAETEIDRNADSNAHHDLGTEISLNKMTDDIRLKGGQQNDELCEEHAEKVKDTHDILLPEGISMQDEEHEEYHEQ